MVREFCTALGTLVLSGLSAQNDTLFPSVSGSWDMTTIHWDWDGQDMNFEYTPHHLEYFAEPSVDEFGFVWGTVYDASGPVGLMAVDSGRVYYRGTAFYYAGWGGGGYGDTTLRVLYDFNLEVGDTAYMQNPFSGPPGWAAEVMSIDTVYLGGFPRQRFMLTNGDEWVEGVGSMEGLLRPFLEIFENGFTLDDFCGEYITADQVPYTSCLPLVLDVPEERSLGMRLYPNPASSSVTVSGVRPGAQFRLRDLHGRLVLVSALQDPGIVSLAGIHPGVYVAEIGGRHSKLIIE